MVKFSMAIQPKPLPKESKAPTIDFSPIRIKWSLSGITEYSTKITPILDNIVASYTISPSTALFESFILSINSALIKYSSATNKVITLPPLPPKLPKCALLAQIRKNLKVARSMSNPNHSLVNKLCNESIRLSRLCIKSLQIKSNQTFSSIVY